jgi:hypothetical protein
MHDHEVHAYEIILVNIISRGLCILYAYVLETFGFSIWGFWGKVLIPHRIGREPEGCRRLQELDDALFGEHGIRDMVDTVPWTGEDGQTLAAA